MKTHIFTLQDLQKICSQSVTITYNCDEADTLSLSLKPGVYAEAEFEANDRIILTNDVGNAVVFSGTIVTGSSHSVQGGAGEDVQVEAVNDLGLLERMAYVKKNSEDEFLFPGVTEPWLSASTYAHEVFDNMKGWEGSPLTMRLLTDVADKVPTPEGNGATPAGSLLKDVLTWIPDAVFVSRYGPLGGEDSLYLVRRSAFSPLVLPKNAPIQTVALTARPDLVPPVCALVGGDTYQYPAGVDVRTPGAFIFPVPVDRDAASSRAGGSPNSQKMVVRGVPVPDRMSFERSEREYQYSAIVAPSKTYSFLSRFFPQYKPLLGACEVGEAVISVVSKEDLEAEAALEAEQNGDEDAQPVPANYQDDLSAWNGAVYVLTEGSFPASCRAARNLRGLQWSRGSVTLMVRLPFSNRNEVPEELREAVPALFPGKARHFSEKEGKYVSAWLVRLTVECIFTNRRLRVYDSATTQPCTTDALYDDELDDKPTPSDYRAAIKSYFDAWHNEDGSPRVPFEGSLSLLHDGSLTPGELAGRPLKILGKRPEWEISQTTIIRSVVWDYGQRKITLEVGTRAVLGFEEYLARRMIAKSSRRKAMQRMVLPFDASDAASKKRREDSMTVSPSVNATTSAATTGVHRKPFTLYSVTTGTGADAQSVLWLAGGTLHKNGQTFNVPDSDKQIEKGEPGNSGWTFGAKVKLKWETDGSGLPTYSIYQDYK